MTAGLELTLELLGVPVRIRCSHPEAAARLAVCYARSGRPVTANGGAIGAELEEQAGSWTARVSGREAVEAHELVEAVRALHHELMHAVMLREPELFYVHAGVVALDGRAVVLPGLSQAGKSTLVLAFLCAGARLLSDELLAFDPRSGCALPFPRAIKVRDPCLPYFPQLEASFVGQGEGRFLPFDALGPDAVAGPTSVRAVVAPRWDGDVPTELEPTSEGQMLLELTRSALNFGTHRTQSLDHLTNLVRGAACFRLSWREPHEAVALVRGALDGER